MPPVLLSLQPAALWEAVFRASWAAPGPTAKDSGHRYFHAKSLFGTCVMDQASRPETVRVFTLCREIQELCAGIHLCFDGILSTLLCFCLPRAHYPHPPSPLITQALLYCLIQR